MLIGRLRHNVIKAGIKRINASYSCISLQHIAEKLTLDSENDALYTVAKAIKDNVIEARIDYDQVSQQYQNYGSVKNKRIKELKIDII